VIDSQGLAEQPLRFVRGQDLSLRWTMDRKRAVTGWTVVWTLRKRVGKTVVLTKTAALTDTTYGVFTVTLAEADTLAVSPSDELDAGEGYVWDLKRTDSGSNVVLARGTLDLLLNAGE
jgi:hypothetical protein